MQAINAISIAPNAKDWLANVSHPQILHVFDHACNLINERREVLSVVTLQIGDGPFSLVVHEGICFSKYLSLESTVSTSPTRLDLGDLIVDSTNAKIWNPYPDWERLHTGKADIGYQLMQLQIADSSPSNPPISNFSSALAAADLASSLTAAQKLAGLGIGLTPAGDDYLMGAMYAAWIIHPQEVASTLTQEIANTSAPLTTSLSAAWLRSAGRGEAGILWHRFFDALVSTDIARSQRIKKDILAVGETSGADALAGFASVFAAWMEKTGSFRG
jgi:hypothetical protein